MDSPDDKPRSRIIVRGNTVTAVTPEGQTAAMPLRELLATAAAGRQFTRNVALAGGAKFVFDEGSHVVQVIEVPPRVHSLKWIAADSPAVAGPDAIYRRVRVSLPYVVVFAVLGPRLGRRSRRHPWSLSDLNAVYFRNAPLRTATDTLHYPALLNCANFIRSAGAPMSFLCLAQLDRSFEKEKDCHLRQHLAIESLMSCLFASGFNTHAESNGMESWFTKSRHVDPRISSVEAWERATTEDPGFVLEVPWLESRHTVSEVADHILACHHGPPGIPGNVSSLVRYIMQRAGDAPPNEPPLPDDPFDILI